MTSDLQELKSIKKRLFIFEKLKNKKALFTKVRPERALIGALSAPHHCPCACGAGKDSSDDVGDIQGDGQTDGGAQSFGTEQIGAGDDKACHISSGAQRSQR